MSDSYEFIIEVDDKGYPAMYNRDGFVNFFKRFKQGERLYGKVSTKRTLKQNRLFHMWIGLLADYIGNADVQGLKKYIKYKMGWYSEWVNEETGEVLLEFQSSKEWSKGQMRENLDKLNIWVIEYYGFYLPWPEEYREANK